jgi:hypothetical protein
MRSAAIILAAAAVVSAGSKTGVTVKAEIKVEIVASCDRAEYKSSKSCEKTPSTTYKAEVPKYQKYNCDATKSECHAPDGYGKTYGDGSKYTYKRQFPYPGPKARFCLKLKKLKAGIKGLFVKIGAFFHKLGHKLENKWIAFKARFEEWLAIGASDLERFLAWKQCQAQKWKDFWEYYHDLCRTRKALWDDAMREFHRHWHHYKKCRKEEYEEKRKECKAEASYDEDEDYKKPEVGNYLGYTPYEVKNYGVTYDQPKYDEYNKQIAVHEESYKGAQDLPYSEEVAKKLQE